MSRQTSTVKLYTIADVLQGQSPESEYYSDSEGTPFLQGNRTFGTLYPSFDTYTKKVTKLARKGDVLMSVRAPVGALNFAPCDLCIGRGLASIKAKNGDSNFIYYALRYNVANLVKQGGATTFDSVNKETIENFDLVIPNDETDRKNSALLLSALDKKIQLNNKINTELEAMAKLIYDYWFVQFDFPDKNGNPFKSSGGKMVWNDELKKEIPEGWEVKQLSDLIKIERGISYTSKDIQEAKGQPMLNLNSFYLDGSYKVDGVKYFSGTASGNKTAAPGDLLIAATDVTRNADIIGKSFIVPNIFHGNQIYYSMDLAKIVPIAHIGNHYLRFLFNSDFYHSYIKYFATGTLVLHLNMDGVNWFKLPLPPSEIISKFNELMHSIESKKSQIIKENQKLVELRDWLLPMLMNGQVKVSE